MNFCRSSSYFCCTLSATAGGRWRNIFTTAVSTFSVLFMVTFYVSAVSYVQQSEDCSHGSVHFEAHSYALRPLPYVELPKPVSILDSHTQASCQQACLR